MKISTKNKSIIAAIAAVATISVMSSCSNDSPSSFNALPGQGFGAATATSADSAKTKDAPETLPVYAHHIGETIKKHVDGYGDAVFTCISSRAPYYFIHTSNRAYSPKEMDAMHYQQNPLAVDEEMFKNIAEIAVGDWATNYANKSGEWNDETISKYIDEFQKVYTIGENYNVHQKRGWNRIIIDTKHFWIRSTECSYPNGSIQLILKKGKNPSKVVSVIHESAYFFVNDQYMMFAFTTD